MPLFFAICNTPWDLYPKLVYQFIQNNGFDNIFIRFLTSFSLEITYCFQRIECFTDHPQNIDVVWKNSFGIEIMKGIQLILKCDLYYDDDKISSISNSNAVGGVFGYGKRLNVIEQLLLTYSRNF